MGNGCHIIKLWHKQAVSQHTTGCVTQIIQHTTQTWMKMGQRERFKESIMEIELFPRLNQQTECPNNTWNIMGQRKTTLHCRHFPLKSIFLVNLRAKRGGSLFEGCWYETWSKGSPAFGGFFSWIGLKCWNILTKLGKKVDFSIAESVAWFVFWWRDLGERSETIQRKNGPWQS